MKKLITLLLLSLVVGVTETWADDVYRVSGSSAILGSNWNPTDNSNTMTSTDNTNYILVKEVTLANEVSLEYKITKNGDYYQPENNKSTTIPAGTKYVIFYFNTSNNTVSETPVTEIHLKGTWNSWGDGQELSHSSSNVWSGTFDLSSYLGDYEFKLVQNSSAYFGPNNASFTSKGGWVNPISNASDANGKIFNSVTGYKTYTVTATWMNGWTLNIVGKDARTEHVNSITFLNNGFTKVYAYPFTGNAAFASAWPGVELEKTGTTTYGGNSYDVYTFYVTDASSPASIKFSDNGSSETAGWPFSASFQYIMNLPATGYYIVKYDGSWAVGDAMTEPTSGTYRGSVTDWANKAFAIAPNTAVCGSDFVDDGLIIRPVTDSGNWIVNFQNYSGVGCTTETGGAKAWQMAQYNDDKAEINFTPASTSFTINSSATVTIGSTGYATYSNNWAYQLDATCDVYTITQAENNEATTNKLAASASIPARTGVILYDAPGDYTVTPASGDAVDVSSNLLVGSGSETYLISGDLGGDGNRYYTPYVLTAKGGNVRFYLLDLSDNNLTTAQKTLAPHKAFLAANRRASQSAPAICDFFNFNFGENSETTDISASLNKNEEIINKNVFNLAGQRVMNPSKGLYIVNGKKVVIK